MGSIEDGLNDVYFDRLAQEESMDERIIAALQKLLIGADTLTPVSIVKAIKENLSEAAS
jgi:hypothetical protein